MIKNEREYDITKALADRFAHTLAKLNESTSQNEAVHPLILKAHREGIESQLETLRDEIAEYEALRSGEQTTLELPSFAELPGALIKARIAAGLSQKELAERLGLQEQDVEHYEDTNYASADIGKINEVTEALGVSITSSLVLPKK